jgi:hypothetical protein
VFSISGRYYIVSMCIRKDNERGLYLEGETSRVNMVMSNIILVVVRLLVLMVGMASCPR